MRERIQSPGSLAILILFQVLAVGPCCFSQTRGLNTWFVDSLVKVFPSDGPGTHALVMPEFWGARNQHVSIQLAIRSFQHLSPVTAEVTSLDDGNGQKILPATVQPVGYVVVGSHSSDTYRGSSRLVPRSSDGLPS